MNTFAKNFIEKHINLIEDQDWVTFFNKLIDYYRSPFFYPDYKEVIDILDKAEIDYNIFNVPKDHIDYAIRKLGDIRHNNTVPGKILRNIDVTNTNLLNSTASIASKIGFTVYKTNMFTTPAYIFLEPSDSLADYLEALKNRGYRTDTFSFTAV